MAVPASLQNVQALPHRWVAGLLILVAFALFLPGFASLPPMDRDEPRFAQASKQMLETGDYVAIRFQEEARNKKPVGIYWLQAGSVALGETLGVDQAREQIWLYRLPSLLAAVLVVLGTYWAALAFTTQRGAVLAALLIGSTVLMTVEAHLAKTDAVLCATVVFTMGGLARLYLKARLFARLNQQVALGWVLPSIVWTAIAVGLLVKGPITPLVAAFAIAVLCIKERSVSWLRTLRPGPGILWVLLLVLPWFVMILLRTKGAFLADSLGHDMLGKVSGVQESHGAPPGTYLAAFWATGWPMTPFVALAAPLAWRRRKDAKITFLLAWILPTWLMFEVVPTKLPHYVLPVYPALAILAAALLVQHGKPVLRRSLAQGVLVAALIALMPVAIGVVLLRGHGLLWDALTPGVAALAIVTMVAIVALAVWAGRSMMRGDTERAVLASTAAALLAYLMVLGHLLAPDVANRLTLSARLAAAGAQSLQGDCGGVGETASAGDHEPSLVFLSGTNLRLTDGAGAGAFMKAGECRVAFVSSREKAAFEAGLDGTPGIVRSMQVSGTAVNGAKSLDIDVMVRQRQRP